jgi:leader peptidase (prepilin peptidase) / N-methyltransferase
MLLPYAITAFVLGTAIGSFLNVVIYRLPRDLSLGGRSACPGCGNQLAWYDLVPIFSFLVLRARCRRCRTPIAGRYPLVELLTGLLAVAVVMRFGFGLTGLLYFAFGAALLAVTFIDLEWQIIPDAITLPGVAIGLAAALFARLGTTSGLLDTALLVTPLRALIGAAGGALGLWLVAFGYQRVTKIEGLGLGDVKLAALLGAFLGGGGVFLTILLASLVGSMVGVGIILAGRGSGRTALPFGTFLAPAGLFVLFYGPAILGWYLRRFQLAG